jgi:quinohemoprotein ethanol dehydrogenase
MRRNYRAFSLFMMVSALLIFAVAALHSDDSKQASDSHEWPLVHGDWTNDRYSMLNQINTNTVKQLGGAWVSKKFEDGASTRSSPVVRGGIMYITAGTRVYALNARTGETRWTWRSTVALSWQGVAIGEGHIFVGLQTGRVEALDEKTGKSVWSQQIGESPPQKGESVTGAPTYAQGIVFVGLANGDWALRGRVVALDAKTGHELWHFFTVPGPGEMGHDTWDQKNNVWKIGGGGVWQTGAVDPGLGLVYFVSGNPIPPFGGEERPGNNLFTCSALALDMKTGTLRWHYQLVHHDVWEADIATPLVLYDAQVGGRKQKALAVMRADGYLFLLNRKTGQPILPVKERPVPQDARMKTSSTQPYPVGAEEVLPDCEKWRTAKIPSGFQVGCFFTPSYYDELNVLRPFFGMRIAPMSYSRQTGYFYATGVVFLGWRRRTDDPYMLLDLGDTAPGLHSSGVLAAINSRTDKIVWQKDMSSRGGGLLTTAGGLIFESEADGNFTAYDAETGDILWQFQIGLAGRGLSSGGRGPATTYEIDGEQYVAVPAGSSIWAFNIGGKLQPVLKTTAVSSGDDEEFSGPITDTNEIETTSLDRDANQPVGGRRYYIDEYKFNPMRTRVKTGTRVTWVNNGKIIHTIMATDGSWTTGPISPAQNGYVTFDKTGSYTYICQNHPWVYGQLIVVDQSASNGIFTEDQANRGKGLYNQTCRSCHTENLKGGDQVPPLVGETFMSHWQGRSVKDLFDRVRTTMPQNNPGSLSDQDYIDIISYLLQANDFPQGMDDLKSNSKEAISKVKK